MKHLNIVGLDPSLSNFGMVKGKLYLDSGIFKPEEVSITETSSDKANKKTVRKNSDDLERAKKLYTELTEFISEADLVFVEVPHGSQSARSMASYGICIGTLGSITLPMIQVTAIEVKKAATNKKTATKEEMIAWASKLYPDLPWPSKTIKGVTSLTGKCEHIADAIAAIHAGCKTEQFKQLLTVYRNK